MLLGGLFSLDPELVFLNHGSFGACPRPVFDAYQAWQRDLERSPVEFLGRRLEGLLDSARLELAGLVGGGRRISWSSRTRRPGSTPSRVRWGSSPATRSSAPTTSTERSI